MYSIHPNILRLIQYLFHLDFKMVKLLNHSWGESNDKGCRRAANVNEAAGQQWNASVIPLKRVEQGQQCMTAGGEGAESLSWEDDPSFHQQSRKYLDYALGAQMATQLSKINLDTCVYKNIGSKVSSEKNHNQDS